MGFLEKIGAGLQGKKAYLTAGLIAAGAAMTYLGYVIPEWVWALLGAMGLGAVRSAINKIQPPQG